MRESQAFAIEQKCGDLSPFYGRVIITFSSTNYVWTYTQCIINKKKKRTRKKEAVGTEILGQQALIRLLGILSKPRRRR